jgi:hypothetical protein
MNQRTKRGNEDEEGIHRRNRGGNEDETGDESKGIKVKGQNLELRVSNEGKKMKWITWS